LFLLIIISIKKSVIKNNGFMQKIPVKIYLCSLT
jgi:hypothetical protein